DIFFVPGGTFLSPFKPFVTVSQNMLPFEMKEVFRFKNWFTRIKFFLLFLTQSYTFRKADGIIFLTNYAKDKISKAIRLKKKNIAIIPHGISERFFSYPKEQKPINNYHDGEIFGF